MADNPTKILLYDLAEELQKVFNELKIVQGSFDTLNERFTNIDVDMLADDEKEVIQDLIDAYNNDDKGLTRERIQNIEKALSNLQVSLGNISIDNLETGNFDETFTYDDEGNVINHEMTGDRSFTVTYSYKSDGSGELIDSVKSFTDDEGNDIEITKEYTYTDGDITGIKTRTSVTPNTPPDPVS